MLSQGMFLKVKDVYLQCEELSRRGDTGDAVRKGRMVGESSSVGEREHVEDR